MSKFDNLIKETQAALDKIVPGKVKVGVMFDDEVNRHYITGESELRMRVSYDYDSDMIIPAKVKLMKKQYLHHEDIGMADLLISYYEQRKDHMMATDEEVLVFRGHPSQFQKTKIPVMRNRLKSLGITVKEGIIS